MREIKFRGRRVDNGKWVYGLPKYGSGGNINYICGWFGEQESPLYDEIEVSPNTVGQFTECKDKNKIEIYEGDLITMPVIYKTPEGGDHKIWEVVFIYSAWHLKDENRPPSRDEYSLYQELECYEGDIKKIGNIYENKELLK
jgi:uncharacterized phage protein (TIGR01671 family)